MSKLDIGLLEGWMVKKNSGNSKSMFSLSSENKRWFKVREVKGVEETELTLAYYASHRAKEAKGFIYLRDVTSIHATEDLSITIKSPARAISVVIETPSEHAFWLEGLVHLCVNAEASVGPNVTLQYKYSNQANPDEKRSYTADDAKESYSKNPQPLPEPREIRAVSSSVRSSRDFDEEAIMPTKRGNDNVHVDLAPSKSDREDHRLSGYRTGSSGGTTARLHGHIRKDTEMPKTPPRQRATQSHADAKSEPINFSSDEKDADVSLGIESTHNSQLVAPDTPNVNDLESVNLDSNRPNIRRAMPTQPAPMPRFQDSKSDFENQENRSQSEPAQEDDTKRTQHIQKAADEITSSNTKKASIDDLLRAPSMASGRKNYDSDEEKHGADEIDLVNERRYYEDAKAQREGEERNEEKTSGRSRSNSYLEQHLIERDGKHSVPRPPVNSPPAYAQQVTGVVKAMHVTAASENPKKVISSTDGRIAVDKNFADEDWDKSFDYDSPDKNPVTNSRVEGKTDLEAKLTGGVRADENWLEDDFDL